MRKQILFLALALTISQYVHSSTWHVGPAQLYTLPSQISALVADADTIMIDGGIYSNDAVVWNKKNLTFIGLGSGVNRTVLQYTGDIPNGKGIWVFPAAGTTDNAYIENIVFDGAQVSDGNGGNGAGIRFQAKDLTVVNCKFINCQNGILEGNGSVNASNLRLEGNEFTNNGYAGTDLSYFGYEHHIYISASVDSLWVINNYFHDPRGEANSLKTRAQRSWILNNYIDEANGYGSWELNLAQGGLCIVMGNVIIQGASGANHGICSIDAAVNPINEIYFINNTVINKYSGNVYFFRNFASSGITTFKWRNNVFASTPGASNTWLTGAPAVADTANNVYPGNYNTVGFVNPAAGNYNLNASAASLINMGTSAGLASNGYSLTPAFMYNDFSTALLPRSVYGSAIDLGAYEYAVATNVNEAVTPSELHVFPNPMSQYTTIAYNGKEQDVQVKLMDIAGREVGSWKYEHYPLMIGRSDLKAGLYIVLVEASGRIAAQQKIVLE